MRLVEVLSRNQHWLISNRLNERKNEAVLRFQQRAQQNQSKNQRQQQTIKTHNNKSAGSETERQPLNVHTLIIVIVCTNRFKSQHNTHLRKFSPELPHKISFVFLNKMVFISFCMCVCVFLLLGTQCTNRPNAHIYCNHRLLIVCARVYSSSLMVRMRKLASLVCRNSYTHWYIYIVHTNSVCCTILIH